MAGNNAAWPGAGVGSSLRERAGQVKDCELAPKQIESPTAPGVSKRRFRVRPVRREDVDRLSRMFRQVFRNSTGPAHPALAEDIRRLLVDHPDRTDHTASLVYERDDGDLGGFLGLIPLPMLFGQRPVQAAAFSTWMVEDRARDPEAGALLLRAHLKRQLDATLADTANRMSIEFQLGLGMRFAPAQSLQWVRPLNYAGYAAAVAMKRAGLAGSRRFVSAAARTEAVAARLLGRRDASAGKYASLHCSREEFADAWLALSAPWRLRPNWPAARVTWMLEQADRRPSLGPLRLRLVFDESNDLAGCVAYHIGADRRGVAVSILARPSHEQGVLLALFADAAAQGAVLLCGPADPRLMEGFFRISGVYYRHTCGAVLTTRDADVTHAVLAGDGLLGGLVGDSWTPLATESYP